MTIIDSHAVCAKWVCRFGIAFNPNTHSSDYVPRLDPEEAQEYEQDVSNLFASADDPHECVMMAMADYGLIGSDHQ